MRPSTDPQRLSRPPPAAAIVVGVKVDLLPGLRLRPELLATGLSDDDLARLRRSGRLGRVRRGAYLDGTDERLHTQEARHVLAARAAVMQLPPGAVVSHVSAALLHGLPAWGVPLERVHVTRDGISGGHRRPALHVHVTPLQPDEITTVDGLSVTTVARTVADLARTAPFAQAVAVADAALRRGAITREALDGAVERAPRRRGVRYARRVGAFADAGAESVGESRSRVLLHGARLPPPVLQWEVPARRAVGRTDFAWPELRTVGEFDGRVKYGRLLRPGQEPGDVVFAEKRREDAIRDAGFRVVRWVWADLDDFDDVVARLHAAFAAASGMDAEPFRWPG
jgi:hypothetical protein